MATKDPKSVLLSLIESLATHPDEIDQAITRALEAVGESDLAAKIRQHDDWRKIASDIHERGVGSLWDRD